MDNGRKGIATCRGQFHQPTSANVLPQIVRCKIMLFSFTNKTEPNLLVTTNFYTVQHKSTGTKAAHEMMVKLKPWKMEGEGHGDVPRRNVLGSISAKRGAWVLLMHLPSPLQLTMPVRLHVGLQLSRSRSAFSLRRVVPMFHARGLNSLGLSIKLETRRSWKGWKMRSEWYFNSHNNQQRKLMLVCGTTIFQKYVWWLVL